MRGIRTASGSETKLPIRSPSTVGPYRDQFSELNGRVWTVPIELEMLPEELTAHFLKTAGLVCRTHDIVHSLEDRDRHVLTPAGHPHLRGTKEATPPGRQVTDVLGRLGRQPTECPDAERGASHTIVRHRK